MRSTIRFLGLIVCFLWLYPVEAATCRDPSGFDAWLAAFKREAAASGISPAAIGALDGVAYDPGIVAKDHGQRVFRQSFEQFSGRMVNSYRLNKGQALMKQYAATFARIEQAYGVPRRCWRRLLTIAAAPTCSRRKSWMLCGSFSAATC